MDHTIIQQAANYAYTRMEEAGDRPSVLPLPIQTFIAVHGAQGLIDNGGLSYFYEAEFPEDWPFSFFSDAYRRIGAVGAAECIEKTASMFPFPEPHRKRQERRRFLCRDEPDDELYELSNRICGDESVWEKLAEYVQSNRSAFGMT